MKNHISIVSEVVRGLSQDMALTFPETARYSFIWRDKTLLYVSEQGLAFVTLVLPQCGKWFDHCLAAGRIMDPRPLYHGRRSSSTLLPGYLWHLWDKVFDDSGLLREDPDASAVFLLRQAYCFAKKLDITCEKERTYASVASFENTEDHMVRSWPCTWDDDNPEWGARNGHPLYGHHQAARQQLEFGLGGESPEPELPSALWIPLDRLCRRLMAHWGDLDVWALKPKHGPGAVSDSKHLKYELAGWSRRLNSFFPADWFASHDFHDRSITDVEIGSVMHAVPKTQKGPRLIAAEPTAHQWIQGALQRWLEEKVKASPLALSIDFKDQTLSQSMALEASSTGAFATIDLSEASDRLSTRLVEYVFQGHQTLLYALHACRTRFITIPASLRREGKERMMVLNKFSTMGSAVTFPVQTIVFALLGHLALMWTDDDWDVSIAGMRRRSHRIRVFGDDIIIDARAYGNLVRILTSCGLKVNVDKSFSDGLFREACGMDAFNGTDCTPAYIRKPYDLRQPESLDSVVECANNFHRKGLWQTADLILKTVPEKQRKLLIRSREDFWPLAVYTFCGGSPRAAKARWNASLQRMEYLSLSSFSKVERQVGSGEASLLQYFTEDPSSQDLVDWSVGQATRPRISISARWVGGR